MPGYDQQDAMIARLEGELAERNAFIQGVIGGAQDAGRDLTDSDKESLNGAKSRIAQINEQLDALQDARGIMLRARERAVDLHREVIAGRRQVDMGEVEYRSAGQFMLDQWDAALGNRDAKERMDVFLRAAAHQKTSDNLGIVPDPIVGDVINFIDAARPIVNALGPRPMPSATWHRPKVTQRTNVDKQGTNGLAADEKSELVSQKMVIGRVTGNAVTYGGYVNVSRQNIDFSSPQALDIIVNDLAAQYALDTEAAAALALDGADSTPLELTGTGTAAFTADNLTSALWTGAGEVYNAVKGNGRLVLAVPPAQLGNWGKLFAPVNPQNSQSQGFSAANFGQGVVGAISGIPVVVSAGLPSTTVGVLFSTAAVEVYEQRVGTLQATEPSVLGLQVAYAGYFTPMVIEAGGVYKIVNAA